jgi:MOSC domain-containing protein YiiM
MMPPLSTSPPKSQGILRAIATRPAKRAPMVVHQRMEIDANAGLAADFGRKPGKGQVTVVAAEKWAAACAALGADMTQVPWTYRRANLLVEGIPLAAIPGARITIGQVVLEVTGETEPCSRMDEQHPGLRIALIPDARAGVRCRIVSGGAVAVSDPVLWDGAAGSAEG